MSGSTPKQVLMRSLNTTGPVVDRLLAELERAGFVVVPSEPTEDMVRAAHRSTAGWLGLPGPHSALSQALFKHAHRYRAMVREFHYAA